MPIKRETPEGVYGVVPRDPRDTVGSPQLLVNQDSLSIGGVILTEWTLHNCLSHVLCYRMFPAYNSRTPTSRITRWSLFSDPRLLRHPVRYAGPLLLASTVTTSVLLQIYPGEVIP
jgi:hypothetical protein